MAPSTPVIDIHGLDKYFGKFQALNALDLTVEHGEVHGFLGPNGAGKSTAIRVLLGLLNRDGGSVQLLGADPWADATEIHRRLAYVPGDVTLWPGMSGGEAIDLLGALRGGLNDTRRQELLEHFELDPTKKGHQYSKGNRQKVALVAALASDAELLILDEPTSGLDPLMENVFQEEIAAAVSRGTTVLLSSHILSEVENLADRLSIIRDGHRVQTGTLDELRGNARTTVRATLSSPISSVSPQDAIIQFPGFHDIGVTGTHFTATVEPDDLGESMVALSTHGITSLSVEPPSLESLFLGLYSTPTNTSTSISTSDPDSTGSTDRSPEEATR